MLKVIQGMLSLALLVALVLPIPTPGEAFFQSDCDPNTDYLALEQEAFASGDFALLIEVENCLLEQDPTDGFLYYNRAVGHYETGNYGAAIEDLALAIEYSEFDEFAADAYFFRGAIYHEIDETDLALADFVEVFRILPDDEIYWEDVQYYFDIETIEQAIASSQSCTEVEPGTSAGQAALEAEDYPTALGVLTCALEYEYEDSSELADIYLMRGEAYQYLDTHDNAIRDFTQALDLDEDLYLAYLYRGISYQELGSDETALEDFTAALELNEEDDLIHTYIGISLQYMGEDEDAIEAFNAALEINPENTLALTYRALSHFMLGDTDSAQADLEAALEINPDEALAYSVRGQMNFYLGEDQSALRDLSLAINLAEDNEELLDEALSYRGQLYFFSGNDQKAVEDLNLAIAYDDNATVADESFFYRGVSLYLTGQSERALEDLNESAFLDEDDAYVHFFRGQVLDDLGLEDEAQEAYRLAFIYSDDDELFAEIIAEFDPDFSAEDYFDGDDLDDVIGDDDDFDEDDDDFGDDDDDFGDDDIDDGDDGETGFISSFAKPSAQGTSRTALRNTRTSDRTTLRANTRGAERNTSTALNARNTRRTTRTSRN